MQEINVPIQAEQDARTLVERRAAGRALRNKASRSSHAAWAPAPNRPVPLSLLEEQNRSRLAHLVPLRYQRMSVSPFTFLRGSAIVMAQDLASTPVSGINVQVCGDAHLNNFGIYATPERNQVFDVNDFDETLHAPWAGDIKRLHNAELTHRLSELVDEYKVSLQDDRRVLLSKYHVVDVAQKVVGVGSVGTRCYVVLLLGSDESDPLLLQIKEAQTSVLERHLGP